MRLYLRLSRNKELIPFNYQPFLVGAIHKWLGENNKEHGKISLHSFSWLQNVDAKKYGINLKPDSYFFISAYEDAVIKRILKGVMADPSVCFGAVVTDVEIVEQPIIASTGTFAVASPVLIKKAEGNKTHHILYNDVQSEECLTALMCKKMEVAGLSSQGLKIKFDTTYHSPKVKLIRYKAVDNKVSLCPVFIEGSQEQINFVWNVGVGNSTGIGFGAIK